QCRCPARRTLATLSIAIPITVVQPTEPSIWVILSSIPSYGCPCQLLECLLSSLTFPSKKTTYSFDIYWSEGVDSLRMPHQPFNGIFFMSDSFYDLIIRPCPYIKLLTVASGSKVV